MNNKPKKKNIILRIGITIVLCVGALFIIGAAYQFIASQLDKNKLTPPGELIQVDDRSMHLYCTGSGSPTVILEAGAGDYALGWAWVQPEIAQHTRVCSYDRAGLGFSDPAEEPRDSKAIANDLVTLLENAGIEGPYILVGHSRGGLFVRQTAALIPDQVVGMVLVEAKNENELNVLPTEFNSFVDKATLQQNDMCINFAPFGIVRLFGFTHRPGLPAEYVELDDALRDKLQFCKTMDVEYTAQALNFSNMESLGDLGDLPLIVIARGEGINPAQLPGLSEETVSEVEEGWMKLQQELSTLSSNSEYWIAENSTHNVHIEQPEIVIQAILTLLSE